MEREFRGGRGGDEGAGLKVAGEGRGEMGWAG